MKILVVDDEPFVRELITKQLQAEDHEVRSVGSVDSAIEALEAARYDLLVTDVLMPNQDGAALMKHTRRYWPDMHIVAITAGFENAQNDYMEYAALYADQTLQKPIPLHTLLETVNNLG